MTLPEALQRVGEGRDLSAAEMADVMTEIMEGRATEAQIGGLLMALRVKGENVDEIAGAASAMRRQGIRIQPKARIILDTCGTGGDQSGTFNISTAAALVAAASGVAVAKHGNRAMSGHVGGADVLEALGVQIEIPPARVAECIDAVGIGFLFAQSFHPAMRYAARARRELGLRTLFNLLGPLCNPAGATHQIVGVFADRWTQPLAASLGRLGSQHALVVHGAGGLDEVSLVGFTEVAELRDGAVRTYRIAPEQFGFDRCGIDVFRVGSPEQSADFVREVLAGVPGARTDIVLLNAGAALYAASRTPSIAAGVEMARESIQSGKAEHTLSALVEFTRQ